MYHMYCICSLCVYVCVTYCGGAASLLVMAGDDVMLLESVVSQVDERLLVTFGLTNCCGVSRIDGMGEF